MIKGHAIILSCAVAAALLLTGCGKSDSGSSSSSSSGAGSTSSVTSASQTDAWRTGLGVITKAESADRAGEINTIAAAVLMDADGKVTAVELDELECAISSDSAGNVTMPTDWRTKRQKGDDYKLAEVSSIKKSWAEQADAFAEHLVGMTAEKIEKLETDEDGKAKDSDLLSSCTIAVDGYRDAVAKACAQAEALGAARGDELALGIEAADGSSSLTATDDKNVNAQADITVVVLTAGSDGRVTSAIADEIEAALTVSSDGGIDAPDSIMTKLEQGDDYGLRTASALGKEWYEHSEGFCSYLKGKTAAEIADIPTDGSDADLKALCTISVTDMQKAAIKALKAE